MWVNSPLQPDLNPSFNGTRFITTSEGVTHDLLPTIDRINSGQSLTFRNDGSIFYNKYNDLPFLKNGVYREFVHPTPGLLKGAGPMRIITGNNGMWFTPDHYITFIRIKF